MQASAIFQRTESGRSEIRNKLHGLTQSERLALIVIDGNSTYGELRTKLKGLSEERFDRALTKLLQKSFVFEVLMDDGQNIVEEFDAKTVDKFLHQDPMDAVTIMSFDPEEEFDLDMPGESAATPQFNNADSNTNLAPTLYVAAPTMASVHEAAFATNNTTIVASTSAPSSTIGVTVSHSRPKPVLKIVSVDFYVPLEPSARRVPEAVSAVHSKLSSPVTQQAPRAPMSLDESVLFATRPDRKKPWGLLLLLVGGVVIAVSMAIIYFR